MKTKNQYLVTIFVERNQQIKSSKQYILKVKKVILNDMDTSQGQNKNPFCKIQNWNFESSYLLWEGWLRNWSTKSLNPFLRALCRCIGFPFMSILMESLKVFVNVQRLQRPKITILGVSTFIPDIFSFTIIITLLLISYYLMLTLKTKLKITIKRNNGLYNKLQYIKW